MRIFIYPCDRCREYSAGKSYRVSSEKDGERLLDMVVCYECFLDASQLGLDTEPVEMGQLGLQ